MRASATPTSRWRSPSPTSKACPRTCGRRSRATTPARCCSASIRRPSCRCSSAPRSRRPASCSGAPSRTRAATPTWRCSPRSRSCAATTPHLFGLKTFADFQLRRRMVENSATAARFLERRPGRRAGARAARPRRAARRQGAPPRHAARDDEARALGRLLLHRAAAPRALQRRPGGVPALLPARRRACAFVMRIAERMLGIRYTRVAASLWHDDVRAYAVSDANSGKPLATLYVDLYPREGKYNHAAVWPLRSALDPQPARAAGGAGRQPGPQGPDPRRARDAAARDGARAAQQPVGDPLLAAGGSENVQWDFVEAPSQMLEDWVYDKKVLEAVRRGLPGVPAGARRDDRAGARRARLRQGRPDGAPAPLRDLRPGAATATTRPSRWRCGPDGRSDAARLRRLARSFPAGFAHIAGGYAAGYYGYL